MKHSTGLRNLFSGALFAAAHEGLNPGKKRESGPDII
jgi:hypothetical protein